VFRDGVVLPLLIWPMSVVEMFFWVSHPTLFELIMFFCERPNAASALEHACGGSLSSKHSPQSLFFPIETL